MDMTFTDDMIIEDEKRWHARNIVTELGYCGDYMRDRKNMTDLDIRFYAYIMRKAYYMLKEQEPVLLKNQHKPGGHFINANSPWISRCPRCGRKVEGRQTRYCKYCGQAVKWE